MYSKFKSLSAVNESCTHARVLHARVHVACVPESVVCMCTCACARKHLHACVHTRIWVHMHASTCVRVSAYNVCTYAVFPFAASKRSDIYTSATRELAQMFHSLSLKPLYNHSFLDGCTETLIKPMVLLWFCRALKRSLNGHETVGLKP